MDKLCKIRELQRAVAQFEASLAKLYGICLNEGMTLCTLIKNGPMTPGELGEQLGLTHSNISKVLRAAEDKELIEGRLCQQDRRRIYFSPTEKGRQLLAGIKSDQIETPELLQTLLDN